MDLPEIINVDLINYLKQTYLLDWNGIHGWAHWMRVYQNGMRLASQNGADERVVTLFAFTHDMARVNEGWENQHGPRAAERIRRELQGTFFTLPPKELMLLTQAVEQHTRGLVVADISVQTCWDADRLDLGRVGIRPDPEHLCTKEARDPAILEWAYERSRHWNTF